MAKNDVVRVVRELPRKKESKEEQIRRIMEERDARTPRLGRPDPSHTPVDEQRVSLPEYLASKFPTGASRDAVRMATRGVARTGNMILRTLDLPNRVFGNSRSLLQDIYERSEANMARGGYEDTGGVPQVGETAVHLATAGAFGKALPAVFGANVGADTYETAKYTGASEGEAIAKGLGHGAVDTAIWTLGQGLTSKYLPKSWQWLGRELTGAGRGVASSVTSDAMLNSLGADISGEEMAKHAVHAAWMVPLLGMLKMGGKRREESMALLRKARPDLAGLKADKVIETIEAEFSDPKSQKVALAWVARKGANLPDDTAQIKQALEVVSKARGLDPMSKSPFEILSDPAYARYLPKPRPQDVKAFSNMKRYPEGVIGFDVSDDAAGRQATREMINAYMSPSSNPWCLATGKGAAKLGGLGPEAKTYWKSHSAVPKQIFFQDVEGDGRLELIAFRATSSGGEGRQEYWDTSDAGYSGIPIKKKIPGDPLGRYEKYVFKPGKNAKTAVIDWGSGPETYTADELRGQIDAVQRYESEQLDRPDASEIFRTFDLDLQSERADAEGRLQRLREALTSLEEPASNPGSPGEVQGTFENIAPGKIFKGDPFRDGRSQTWVEQPPKPVGLTVGSEREIDQAIQEGIVPEHDRERLLEEYRQRDTGILSLTATDPTTPYVLVEDKVRTTENGITRFRTTKYADPTDPSLGLYEGDENLKAGQPVEIEESELVSPEWMRSRGYDPESESDVSRMQRDLNIRAWGNGVEAAMAVVPTKRTYMQTKSGTPETVTYGPNGRDVVSVDFVKDGVPYREEYFYSGPGDRYLGPGDKYPLKFLGDRVTLGIRGLPTLSRDYLGTTETDELYGFRLMRNPGGESPEVLDELKWDDGLGGFVRTSGSRRWRMITDTSGSPEVWTPEFREGSELFSRKRDAERSFYDVSDRLGDNMADESLRQSLRQMYSRASEARITASRAYHTWVIQHPDLVDSHGEPFQPRSRHLQVEARQPDGTWAPVPGAAMTLAEARASDQLPASPRSIPFALKAGRTRRNVRAAEGAGDTEGAPETAVSGTPVPEAPARPSGPRIVLNPQVFKDKRDALCVAFNEAFRLVMEENGFEPVSEPTEAQRRFFADTAYADDELQLRRTILARIATLDTSVKDPTDEQLEETAEMLEMVMEVGAPQNEWEQSAVQRLHDVVVRMRESPRSPAPEEKPEETGSARAAEGAGVTMTGSELDFLRRRYERGASMSERQRALVEAANAQGVKQGESGFVNLSLNPPGNAQPAQPAQPVAQPAQPVAQPVVQPVQPVVQPAQQPVVNVTAASGGMVDWDGNPTYGAGMRIPGRDELAALRRRRDSGASLSARQRRILELTDGNNPT